jgi:hypothetical protein
MSFTAMSWASKQKTKTASQKLVLLMLANYADDTDKCWPSKKTLSEVCCMAKSAICSNILQLEQAGFIRVEKREGTSSYIWLNTGVLQEDRGCPVKGQGVSVKRTGGVLQEDTNLSYTLSTEPITETISVDAGFDTFWAAYPKRTPHSNPKAPARDRYAKARKCGVSHETIMVAVTAYAESVRGADPKFTAQAQTWLFQKRWADEYGAPAETNPATQASDEQLDTLAAAYPGHIGERDRAKKLLAVELSKGVSLNEICVAADKYKLFCKGPPYEDRRITPSMLEPWLQFKWREMDAYEFCRVGADRIRTVRPVKVKT